MYRMDSEKLAEVTRIMNQETDPAVTEEIVEAHVCGEWREGEDHQDWLDSASAREIADWLASLYGDIQEIDDPTVEA